MFLSNLAELLGWMTALMTAVLFGAAAMGLALAGRKGEAKRLAGTGVLLVVAGLLVSYYWESVMPKIGLQMTYYGQYQWVVPVSYFLVAASFGPLIWWLFAKRSEKLAPYEVKFYKWAGVLFAVHGLLLLDILQRVSGGGLPQWLLQILFFGSWLMLLNKLVLLLFKREKGWFSTIKGVFKKKTPPPPPPAAPAPAKKAQPAKQQPPRKTVPPTQARQAPAKKAQPHKAPPQGPAKGRAQVPPPKHQP